LQAENDKTTEYLDIFDKCFSFEDAKRVKAAGYYPYFHPIQSAPGDEVVVDGRKCIMIGSNNYLGLVSHPAVKEDAAKAAMEYGTGCTGSRFLNGTLDLHLELEQKLAEFVGKERALVFSTGFQTNLGTISCLAGKRDGIIIDRQVHACIVDGCRLSYGKVWKFAHNDMADLERVMANARKEHQSGGIMLVVDGVFSMEGDIIDLPHVVEICKKYRARLLVDDAHSVGVLGKTGAGTAEHFGLTDQVDLIMGTFSKSFAGIGGFVAGDNDVIDFVQHNARTMIFSASIPPAAAAAVLAALEIMKREPERRERLWQNARRIMREFRALGLNIGHTATPVVPIIVGDDHRCFTFWKLLLENGLFTNPVVAPAVAPGGALIRTSYTATHTDEQLDRVIETVGRIAKQMGLI
jgi:8-amino-7-oxononanoate synthase